MEYRNIPMKTKIKLTTRKYLLSSAILASTALVAMIWSVSAIAKIADKVSADQVVSPSCAEYTEKMVGMFNTLSLAKDQTARLEFYAGRCEIYLNGHTLTSLGNDAISAGAYSSGHIYGKDGSNFGYNDCDTIEGTDTISGCIDPGTIYGNMNISRNGNVHLYEDVYFSGGHITNLGTFELNKSTVWSDISNDGSGVIQANDGSTIRGSIQAYSTSAMYFESGSTFNSQMTLNEQSTANLNGGSFTGSIGTNGSSILKIKGGTYNNITFSSGSSNLITIEGGSFTNYYFPSSGVTITGGFFDTIPNSSLIANGYKYYYDTGTGQYFVAPDIGPPLPPPTPDPDPDPDPTPSPEDCADLLLSAYMSQSEIGLLSSPITITSNVTKSFLSSNSDTSSLCPWTMNVSGYTITGVANMNVIRVGSHTNATVNGGNGEVTQTDLSGTSPGSLKNLAPIYISEDGKATINNLRIYTASFVPAVYNKGTAILDGISTSNEIRNAGTMKINSGNYNGGVVTESTGTTTIENGVFNKEGIIVDDDGDLIIKDGSFGDIVITNSEETGGSSSVHPTDDNNITIYDGEFNGTEIGSPATILDGEFSDTTIPSGSIIKGGTFDEETDIEDGVSIQGGKFKTKPSDDSVAPGKTVVQNKDGTYSVVDSSSSSSSSSSSTSGGSSTSTSGMVGVPNTGSVSNPDQESIGSSILTVVISTSVVGLCGYFLVRLNKLYRVRFHHNL